MLNFRTSPDVRAYAKARRDRLRDAGRCINGPEVGEVSRRGLVHGNPVRRGRCQECIDRCKEAEVLGGVAKMLTIREVIESHSHLALDNADDREALIAALEHRRKRRRAST